ncbi:glycosyltransferase [Peribacillus sp. FSL H8-0477]|uniref:glycosyltransferase n=1 Tax=Peribacillus sp. FSL H8-0477 TaxID=2921388 RepID=UPI0030FCDDF4
MVATMKKKLLFVIDSLDCAGAEKSLVTLLSLLDYSRYSVDLMLFAHGGSLEDSVPKEVNILPPLKYTEFTKLEISKSFLHSLKMLNFKMFYSRMKYTVRIRKREYGNTAKARIYWESVSNSIENNPKEYEIAISYAQGIPTFYVASKIKAKKKYAWVNTSYLLKTKEKIFQNDFYADIDKIITVSESAKDNFLETYPDFNDKVEIIYDIINPNFITEMAEVEESADNKFDGVRILTIGRLDHGKQYNIALEACKMLKEQGIDFKWYVLGKGPLLKEIEKYIRDHELQDHFILLGVKSNPYPFIKNADIYVQTSKFEGFGLAIAEARLLNVPVVTTRFDAVYNQMVEGKNGLVVDMNGDAVYRGILKLINDHELRERIITYLKNEKKGNIEELEKFYQLIG